MLPVIVDSPMAAEATRAYRRWREEQDEDYLAVAARKGDPLRTASMSTTSKRAESKALNELRGTRIIISASGMLTGGRVLHHALRMLPDPDATLVFVGFQANGTRGRHIQDGAGSIRIMRSEVPVRCNVETVEGFSAHADRDGIMRWLSGLPAAPKRVFLTHGEPTAAVALSHDIKERFGWDAHVPELNESIELS